MLCLCIGLSAGDGEQSKLPGKLSIQTPKGKGPFPCVIICPGRGYHMELPLMKDFADKAVQEGFVAVRFDWTFYTKGSNPSADGSQEIGDVEQVLLMAKQIPEVDPTRIYIAGKSLGSVFGYAVFHDHPELKGCLLMTPVIPERGAGVDYYPDLADEYRKVVFILGNEDFNNCKLNYLYHYLADCKAPIPVVVLAGGHGFNQAGESTDKGLLEIDKYNVKTAVDASVYWLKTFEHPVFAE
jgi:hypothetical protein